MTISRRLRFEILRRDAHCCRYCGAMAPDVKLTVDHVVPVALGGSDEPSNLVTACAECNSGKSSIQPDSSVVEDIAADALRWSRALEAAASSMLVERQVIDSLLDRFTVEWKKWEWEWECTVPPEPVEPTGDPLIDNWRRITRWPAQSCSRPIGFAEGVLLIQVERGWATEVRKALKLVDTKRQLEQILGASIERVEIGEGWDGPIPPPPGPTKRTERIHASLPDEWRQSVERFISLGLPDPELHRLVSVAMRARSVPLDEKFRYFCGCCWRAITDLQEDARRFLEVDQ